MLVRPAGVDATEQLRPSYHVIFSRSKPQVRFFCICSKGANVLRFPINQPKEEASVKQVGRSVVRADALEKVTGQAIYVDDLQFPGMLHGRVLRSPYAHAKIVSIDTSAARQAPGVRAVVTGRREEQDVGGGKLPLVGACIVDQLPLAMDRVRFAGEAVAVVVADTVAAAEHATTLIKVEYAELPVLTDARQAMAKDAPLIHPDLGSYECSKGFHPKPGTNIFHHYQLRKGDARKAFAKCDVVLEQEFSYPHMSHCQLEPHGALVRWDPAGSVEIYSSTQAPFVVRGYLSRAFRLPLSKVRVRAPVVGGGFGGKSDYTLEPLAAYVARQVPGVWIKLIYEREEMFNGTLVGRGVTGRYKLGAKRDGTVLAAQIEYILSGGGYGECAINVAVGGGQNSPGAYHIPNIAVDSYAVYTNLPPVGAFRGYGHPEGQWMAERMMDLLARELKMDPVELRLKNAYRAGDKNAIAQRLHPTQGDLPQCLREAAKAVGWKMGQSNVVKTRTGFRTKAVCSLMKSPVQATNAQVAAILKFDEDGGVNLIITTCDMGQGSATVYGQIAAEALGLPLERVHVVRDPDTALFPADWQTIGSKGTYTGGIAIVRAAEDAIAQIRATAAKALRVPVAKVRYQDGRVVIGKRHHDIGLFTNGYMLADGRTIGRPVVGYGAYTPDLQIPGIRKPGLQIGQGNVSASWTFGAQAVELEVNPKTGQIKVLQLVTAIDAGRIINPRLARGQVVGGMVQALGQTLMETMIYSDKGVLRNGRFTDYKIPALEDLRDTAFKVIFVETPDRNGPFGARGLAEHGTVAIAPCVANAIARATGQDLYSLPIRL